MSRQARPLALAHGPVRAYQTWEVPDRELLVLGQGGRVQVVVPVASTAPIWVAVRRQAAVRILATARETVAPILEPDPEVSDRELEGGPPRATWVTSWEWTNHCVLVAETSPPLSRHVLVAETGLTLVIVQVWATGRASAIVPGLAIGPISAIVRETAIVRTLETAIVRTLETATSGPTMA